jgi:hypothetical protein
MAPPRVAYIQSPLKRTFSGDSNQYSPPIDAPGLPNFRSKLCTQFSFPSCEIRAPCFHTSRLEHFNNILWTVPTLSLPLCNRFSPSCCYKHAPTCPLFTFREVRPKSELSAHTVNYVYNYLRGGQTEIQILTHWSVIGCPMTAPAPVLSPGSIFLPPSSVSRRPHFRKEKIRRVSKMRLKFLFTYSKLCTSQIA